MLLYVGLVSVGAGEPYMRAKHVHGLDLLRLASALAVIAFHYAFRGEAAGEMPALDLPAAIEGMAQYGYLGVSLFFIISGYVIAFSAENKSWVEFASSRFARIYPTFILMMTASAGVIALFGAPHFDMSLAKYAANLVILPKLFGQEFVDGAYWSIVMEIIFYGWIFLLIVLGQIDRLVRILPFWLLLSLLNETILNNEALRLAAITEFSGFFSLGIIIYMARNGWRPGLFLLFMAAFTLSVFTSLKGAAWAQAAYHQFYSGGVVVILVVAMVGLFFAAVNLRVEGRAARIATLLGGVTYPVYLLHQNVGYIAIPRVAQVLPDGMAVLATVSAVLLACLLYHLAIERKLNPVVRRLALNLGDRFGAVLSRQPG